MPHTAALLVSRQPLQPCGETPWVRACLDAVEWLRSRQYILIGSTGLMFWDIILTAALDARLPVRLVIPIYGRINKESAIDRLYSQFDLHSCSFISVDCVYDKDKNKSLRMRDTMVVNRADTLIPVSIRPGGFFERVVSNNPSKIEDRFRVPYLKRKSRISYSPSKRALEPKSLEEASTCIIHWTRTTHSPWPTEKMSDFCRALMHGKRYPRTAWDSLCNILSEKRIVAGDKNMPGKHRCVCFTGAQLSSFIHLMSWRKRCCHMSFEPYGIGIRSDFATKIGICPVVYCRPKQRDRLDTKTPWLIQSAGSIGNWRLEQEFRKSGDLDLSRLPGDALVCFCSNRLEARNLSERFGVKAYHLFV